MNIGNFVIYKHSSGEFAIIKRSEIAAFKPVFITKFQYRIMATVGNQDFAIADVESLEAAEAWILDQIKLIEKEDSKGTDKK